MIRIYTDGSSRGNPGPGGFGTILKFNDKVKEISQGFRLTTNNRMELLAVIVGLESLKTTKIPVTVYSDSKYVIDSITLGWVFGWVKKGFKGKKNKDLWLRYLELHSQFELKFVWVKGHAGHLENERCDQLAVAAAENNPQTIDEGYESKDEGLIF
ncbi:MAG: ribonuclease HI [Flavobacteriales bacterium]|nr:ribonuclease HI [Crocinitomicaceae bacterium]NBX80535.1 ribonuclease HI [Flavobacteriales bacterium]NCA19781.1 ribonuclease HI [Crocinitomicaceae bacterium]